MYYPSYLAHYGVLGMKWGVRRYQNRDGSLTPLGRKHVGVKESTSKKTVKSGVSNSSKPKSSRAEALEKARQAKAEKAAHEEAKKNALARGNATEVLKFKGELSNQELQAAFNRINLEKQLSSIAASEKKSNWDKMDSFVNKVGKLKNYADKGIEVYNLIAKINNSFNDTKMNIIGQDKAKAEKDFSKLVKTGSAEEILKAVQSGKLSPKEREEAIKRLNAEKVLSGMVAEKTLKTDSKETSKKEDSKKDSSKEETKKETPKSETPKEEPKTESYKATWKDVVDSDNFTRRSAAENQARAEEWFKSSHASSIIDADFTDITDSNAGQERLALGGQVMEQFLLPAHNE